MSLLHKNIAVVCNPLAGNGKAVAITRTLTSLLQQKSVAHTVFHNHWPLSFNEFTEAWIAGGDGTLNYFINHYPDVQVPLALFKGGSGNDFHWLLYNNINLAQQVEKVLQATPQWIDAGQCNGRLFLNGVGIGFDGAIVADLIHKKKIWGKTSYLLTVLKHIFTYQEAVYTINRGEDNKRQTCFMISIANGKRYGGGFIVAPGASPADGWLDISVIKKIPVLQRVRYLPVLKAGKHLGLNFVQHSQTKGISIAGTQKIPAHIDGEFLYAQNYTITLLPKRFSFLL